MAEKLFYCDTCNVHLTGPQPATQHYSGSKHRKKEAVKLAQCSTAFSAAVDGSKDVNYSTTTSALGLERQASPLDLSRLPSSYSVDEMKSDSTGTLKLAETAPTYNVVMVPSLNPDLPPVPVTMMENALPQTEYEFDCSSGWCHLCGTELSSQQHADQHLSGQKHVKAKKRWETKREQLQMTVSGLCPSMKSKPIAMCQPLVCETPTRDCISDVIRKHSATRSVPSAAESKSNVVDGMQWFSCDVCGKKMNTYEMLELHRRSPAHLKKVEQQQLTAALPGDNIQQLIAAVPGDNTIWLSCPTCQKKLNSATQLEIHMTDHNRPISLSSYPPACLDGRTTPTVAPPGGQWHHCDVCNKDMNTAVQLELHCQSPAHHKKAAQRDNVLSGNNGDNTIWQTCPLCAKRLNSVKQLDIHVKSHGLPEGSSLSGAPRNNEDSLYSNAENQLPFTADTGGMLGYFRTTLLAAGKINPPVEYGQKLDVTNLLTLVDGLRMKEKTSKDDDRMSGSVERTESTEYSQLSRSKTLQISDNSANQTASQTKFTSAAAAAAADDDDDEHGVMMSENQPWGLTRLDSKDEWSSKNLTSPATCPTDVDLATTTTTTTTTITAAAAADDDDDVVKDDDLISTGCCVFAGCVYHCELCDVHLTGEEPRNMHFTGAKHISCRQKAEETTSAQDNPFGPSFRYFCQLCNVPFNTLRDKLQHERGQQHISKSARCVPAPDRRLPDVVLPTDRDYDSCVPDSLVTSKPRSYQGELYSKALVSDSICFLPTGRFSL